jgi:hypothetical protein
MWSAFTSGAAVSIIKKPDGTLVVGVRITLKPGRDDNLIALMLSAKKLAPTIREAMRNGVIKEVYSSAELNVDDLESVGIEL